MKLHYFILVLTLGLTTTTLNAAEYTHYFLYNKYCYTNNQSCWLKVITDEDNGGLRCRANASLRASIMEVVPKEHYVQVTDLAISGTGRAFFKVLRDQRKFCYMRATLDRFSYSTEYTDKFFQQQGCYNAQNGCSFEVITSEDNGGLRCRASASLRSSIIEVVPKGSYVPVTDLAISQNGKTFFKVSRSGQICYMRATQSRFSFIGKASTQSATISSYIGDKQEIIMTGAGVRLRKTPQLNARRVKQLEIGTIVFLLDKIFNSTGEEWYKIATSNGNEGWVPSKYTMSLDNFNDREQAYVEVANRKINSNNFGDLAELCNFLSNVSVQATKPTIAAELKRLHMVALQRSLDKIPLYQQHYPRYSNWLEKQRSKIEYNQVTGVWSVKKELFQPLLSNTVDKQEIIMTGAGVRLRQTPQLNAKRVKQLEIGTIVFLLDKTINSAGEEWYKIATSNGNEGWVPSKYTMSLDNFSDREQAYVEVANRKINSNDFGDLAELCNFLSRVSVQATKPTIATELKRLHMVALQRSLDKIPRYQQHYPRYSKWLEKQRSKIEYNQFTGVWSVKTTKVSQPSPSYTPNPQYSSNPQNQLFITQLSFMNPSAGMPIESSISNAINQAVTAGVQLVQQKMPHFKLNESGHKIDNSDQNINDFINRFYDFNLTKSQKIDNIIQHMMIPNGVDVILSGQYLEKSSSGTIHIRPLILSKSNRRIVTKSLIFEEKEFLCSNNALCQDAHDKIGDMVKELLGNL